MSGPIAAGAAVGEGTTVGEGGGARVGLAATIVGKGDSATGADGVANAPVPGEGAAVGGMTVGVGGAGGRGGIVAPGGVVEAGRICAAPAGNGAAIRPRRRRSDQSVTSPPAAGRSR